MSWCWSRRSNEMDSVNASTRASVSSANRPPQVLSDTKHSPFAGSTHCISRSFSMRILARVRSTLVGVLCQDLGLQGVTADQLLHNVIHTDYPRIVSLQTLYGGFMIAATDHTLGRIVQVIGSTFD